MRARLCGLSLVLALLVGGCGSSASDGGMDPATLVPADSVVYLEGVLRPEGEQGDAAKSVAGKLLRTDDPGKKIRELVDQAIRESGTADTTFEDDIDPWLGDRIGMGLTDLAGEEPRFVVVIADARRGAGGGARSPRRPTRREGAQGLRRRRRLLDRRGRRGRRRDRRRARGRQRRGVVQARDRRRGRQAPRRHRALREGARRPAGGPHRIVLHRHPGLLRGGDGGGQRGSGGRAAARSSSPATSSRPAPCSWPARTR